MALPAGRAIAFRRCGLGVGKLAGSVLTARALDVQHGGRWRTTEGHAAKDLALRAKPDRHSCGGPRSRWIEGMFGLVRVADFLVVWAFGRMWLPCSYQAAVTGPRVAAPDHAT